MSSKDGKPSTNKTEQESSSGQPAKQASSLQRQATIRNKENPRTASKPLRVVTDDTGAPRFSARIEQLTGSPSAADYEAADRQNQQLRKATKPEKGKGSAWEDAAKRVAGRDGKPEGSK